MLIILQFHVSKAIKKTVSEGQKKRKNNALNTYY